MATTSTLRQILIEITERYGFGKVVPVSSNTTTTFTLTTTGSPELRGPFTGLKIPVGSPVLCTVETSGSSALGNRTYASNWVPSTGVLTVSPAVGDTDVTEIIIFDPSVADPDRMIEAVNRALRDRMTRCQLWPLTYVPDGDMQGATVTDYWTAAANGTAAYASAQIYPAGSAADAVGQVGLNRVVQLTSAGGSTSMDGNGIRVVEGNTQRSWYVQTAIRLVSGSGTATFSIRDNTNNAEISVQVSRGNDSQTMTATVLGDYTIIEGTFQVPDGTAEIAPRLALSATGLVAQMAPIIMFPMGARQFPLPNRIETHGTVGNFRYGISRSQPGGINDIQFSDPITDSGREHELFDFGDHMTVHFNFPVHRPVWFEEFVNYATLSAMTDTTVAPLDRVAKWAAFELADQEMWTRLRQNNTSPESELVTRNKKQVRNALLRQAEGSGYEPTMKQVVGRR